MTVRYVRVNPVVDLFAPAVRAYGNIAVVGKVTLPPKSPPTDPAKVNTPIDFTDPAEARRRAPGDLGEAVALAFQQSPGPSLVTAVRVDEQNPDWKAALDVVASLDVQLVVLANTPLNATTGRVDAPEGALVTLAKHVASVSETGGEGRQRMGVAMLPKDSSDPGPVQGTLAHDRMVYVAHRSTQDAAAAVAGAVAGHQPHISLLLKPVNITSPSFSQAEIETLNGPETFESGPAGRGVNWLTSPSIIPGSGVYMGEGYTGNPGGTKYIDAMRTVDDLNFRLNASLIKTIGNVRISRSGLRALIARLEAILGPEVQREVLNGFEVFVPLLTLLDKDPATLTAAEAERIHQAEVRRMVQVMIAIHYAGITHRLSIAMNFN
ncbi:hypothetical protein ACOT81_37350 [Streptomyces sp. WI04-05B]|uniref:hypothetical protein n=1 Tax=Streptomyces TaxID=1883 RepID=UPI0029AE821A|nr:MULTISPECIES: hypothetical protein [unclassified Streptomyces]MDX2547448.1 hypothetical protein [Streptomyces sp. WI04-05B]MDX2586293.1 hypothetical protein [Streptomyces sp. WI04-05A]MDX3748943.1 hypothetical protein [Streptomyces sp. AK08-02]